MGIWSLFKTKKTERNSERSTRSVVKSSKRPEKSGFLKHNAKKFIVMTKATAGNVKANVNYAVDHPQKHFAVEAKGYTNKGTYTPNSTGLAHAIARLKRDGYSVTTATGKNGYGETVTILFAKYGRPVKTTTKRAAAVRKAPKKAVFQLWHGLPKSKVYGGVKYSLALRFDDDEDYDAKFEAKDYRKKGYSVKMVRLCPQGSSDKKICLYVARNMRRA